MSDKLPFEDAFERQMNGLELADQQSSWKKMEQLLDKKERRRFIFFKWLAACGLIALIATSIAVYITTNKLNRIPPSYSNKPYKPANDIKTAHPTNSTNNIAEEPSTTYKKNSTLYWNDESVISKNSLTNRSTTTLVTAVPGVAATISNRSTGNNIHTTIQKLSIDEFDNEKKITSSITANKPKVDAEINGLNNISDSSTASVIEINNTQNIKRDSSASNAKATPQLSKSSIKNKTQKAVSKYWFSTGLGIQQQIPVNGQQGTKVGLNGKSLLADYIPSVYVRVERNMKWFAQAEFIYGAPQLVDQFSYARQTVIDSFIQKTTSLQLKKTYYNEIPVTFNYYVSPKLSVGAGAMYSWIHGTLSEKKTTTSNRLTQQQATTSELHSTKGYTDSFFYKTHSYLLLQSDYQWHRISAGIRYSKDLQPFIKYTTPDGTIVDRRNWSLEFILRYRLFKTR